MAKRKSLGLEQALPTRENRTAASDGKLDRVRDENSLKMISHRLPLFYYKYLAKLSLETGKDQKDLLAESLDLLKEKYGDV